MLHLMILHILKKSVMIVNVQREVTGVETRLKKSAVKSYNTAWL